MNLSKFAWGAVWLVACASIDERDIQPAGISPAPQQAAHAEPAPAPLPVPPPSIEIPAAPSVGVTTPALAPAPLETVIQRAGERLYADALTVLQDAPRDIVIDPFVDATTGQQTVASAAAVAKMERMLAEKFPFWKPRKFSRDTLSSNPLLLLGTLTPVALNDGASAPDAYRLWLTLVDLRSGRIAAKRLDRATLESVNAEPLAFFRDSPTWHLDRTVRAYVNSSQIEARVGDRADSLYLWRLPAAAALREAIDSYHAGQLALASERFAQAAELADPDDLRVLNGLYLSNWRLGKSKEASQALEAIVGSGLAAKSFALKVLFQPDATYLLPGADRRAQYRLWIREVARQGYVKQLCLRVVGHGSRKGEAIAAKAQSERRAAVVRWIMARAAPAGAHRFTAEGVGWHENLVGLGTDDWRDALDRRIEFRVVDCP